VTALGRQFRGYACDFADRKSLYDLIAKFRADVPRIDVLVNNAGTILRKPAAEHPDEYWDKVIEVNLNAQFVLTREIGKDMLARGGGGKIVFVASLLSFQGGVTVPGYAAAKGGIAQLTKALANEWAARGVNVNALAPGYIETPLTAGHLSKPGKREELESLVPAGRLGTPDELTGPALFLSSRHAGFVTGHVMYIDGGRTLV